MAALTHTLASSLRVVIPVTRVQSTSLTVRQALGARGEEIAASYFKRQGYLIEQCNWRFGRLGELDLVLVHPQEQIRVFVEVKTRKGSSCGTALEAITPKKQATLFQLAEAYLNTLAQAPGTLTNHYSSQLDVLGVTFPGQNRPAVLEHIQNAF
jgi:putative endonuclease